MKQHERTHKISKDPDSPIAPVSGVSKPVPAATSQLPNPRLNMPNPDETTSDQPMHFDGDSSKLQLSNQHALPELAPDVRPSTNGRMPSIGGRSEVDGEGDSPGLDALAVASALASDAR